MINSVVEKLAHHAQNQPDKLCFGDCDKSLTYEQVWRLVYNFGLKLKSAGLAKGDKVVAECTQDVEYALCQYGVHMAGCVFVPVEKGAADSRVLEIIKVSDAKMYVGRKAVDGMGVMFKTFDELCKEPFEGQTDLSDIVFPCLDDTSEILFSTGTTGKSKGIECTHANDVALVENVISGTEMEEDTVEFILMPISHSHGLRRYNSNVFRGASSVFVDNVMMIKKMYEMMDSYGVTAIDMSPALLTMIFKLSKDYISKYKDDIKYIQIASAPLSEEAKKRIAELLPNTRMYNFYGSTEAGCSCTADFSKLLDKPGAMGYATANAEFVFMDEHRNIVENPTREKPAYLATGGAQNMRGYWKEPELTAETVHNGYVVSKDLCYRDATGMIYFIGRDDDVINAGGIKISPVEIEAEILKYPQIADCACVPVKDAVQGEVPKLFYVKKADGEFDIKDFKGFMTKNIDANKVPKILEEIVEIPRTYNGKIQRKKLIGNYNK